MTSRLVRLAPAHLVVAGSLCAAAARPAVAQQPSAAAYTRSHAIAINPLGIPFEIVSVEYEGAIQDAFTLGGNFSYFSPDDVTFTTFELKGRLYPNERAPKGFAVGFALGAASIRERFERTPGVSTLQKKTHPSIAVYVDYNWLLGRTERFYVGTGVGAKRILGDEDAFDDVPFVYPTARFLIGVAF